MGADVVSREELYELVWSVPMVRVAEKFKVPGSYMARVCSTLHVPRPNVAEGGAFLLTRGDAKTVFDS
jgi:hypothetical protein